MKISARNQLAGKVKAINVGPINAEVILELAAGVEITAIITRASCERLGLAVGKEAFALVKASDVMLGVCGGGEGGCNCGCKD